MSGTSSTSGVQSNDKVFIGGVVGFDDLADPNNTSLLRATGIVGLYMQEGAMGAAWDAGQVGAIAAGMAGTGPGEVELNLQPAALAVDWFTTWWHTIWTNYGLGPTEDNVIIDFSNASWSSDFAATVAEGRNFGITSFAPIFSPNNTSYALDSFSNDPQYAAIRSAAILGGALAIDAPPAYFFARGAAYQQFTYQEIQWAHQNDLRVTVIISPYGDDASFLADTQAFVASLNENNAAPTEWVVENYNSTDSTSIGSDLDANSVAGVALWVAQNYTINTDTAAASTSPTVSTISVSAPGTVAEASYGAGVTVSETISTVNLPGPIYVAVYTSNNVMESASFVPVTLGANNQGTVSLHFAQSGDYVVAENKLLSPTRWAYSSPITITDPVTAAPVLISGPGTNAVLSSGETLYDTGGLNTLILPAGGAVILSGNTANNGDLFDIRAAMATTTWDGNIGDLGKYFTTTTSNSGKDLQIFLHPTGGTSSSLLATLTSDGSSAGAFARFEQHAILTTAPSGTASSPVFISGPGVTVSLTSGETLYDTGGQNTIVFGAATNVTLSGNVLNNADAFDLRAAMATTTWDGKLSDLSNYLTSTTSNGGADLQVMLHTSGGSSSTVLATLATDGSLTGSFNRFEQECILASPLTLAKPVVISLSSPGSIQEASVGAGATVTENVTAPGLDLVYEAVYSAAGLLLSSWQPVGLDAFGSGSFSVLLPATGDYVEVVNSLTQSTIKVSSSSVVITDPVTAAPVLISGPGTNAVLSSGETLYDTGGLNTLILPAGGAVILSGNTANNGDLFDIRAAMATTTWDGNIGDLGKYFTTTTSNSGKDLQIFLHPTGGTSSSLLATLTSDGSSAGAFARFEQHAILTTAPSGTASSPVFISGPGVTVSLTSGETLYDTGGQNTIVFGAATNVTLSGNVLNNADAFDLRAAMATTTWDGKLSDLSNYLTSTTSNGGADLQVMLHTSGGSSSTVLATLATDGRIQAALGLFENHALL